jgi:hypothetical protein
MESAVKLSSHVTSALDGNVYSPSRSDNFITEETALVPYRVCNIVQNNSALCSCNWHDSWFTAKKKILNECIWNFTFLLIKIKEYKKFLKGIFPLLLRKF